MRWRVAVWTHPDSPVFEQKEHSLSFIAFSSMDPVEPRGRCVITVPAESNWQELISTQNPTDPSDTSMIRLYRDGMDNSEVPDAEFILKRFQKRILDDGTSVVVLYGVDWRLEALDQAVVRWWDWIPGAASTVQPDWSYGGGETEANNLLSNAGFEISAVSDGGLESGTAGTWSGTPNEGILNSGSVLVVNDPVNARTGDYYLAVLPGTGTNSGARRSLSGLEFGENYTLTVWIKDESASGDRLRVGVKDAASASHTNAYLADGYWWAEIGNAVNGAGATNGNWQSTTVTFQATNASHELVVVSADANGPDFWIDDVNMTGTAAGLDPWIGFQSGGPIEVFERETTIVRTGTGAVKWQNYDKVYTNPYSGAQGWGTGGISQRIDLTIGKTYTATGYVRQDSGSSQTYLLILKRVAILGEVGSPGSSYMASTKTVVPSGSFTQLTPIVVESDTTQVDFQVRWQHQGVFDTNVYLSPLTYGDDFSVIEGLGAANLGVIAQDLLDDIQIDHAPDREMAVYLNPTWTDAVDSAAVVWPRDESLIITRGKKYGTHVFGGQFADLGYEYDIVADSTDPDTAAWDFHLWAEGNRGTTRTGMAFVVGMGVDGGMLAGRVPNATRWLGEGKDGIITEVANTAQEAVTGVIEAYFGDPDITDVSTLSAKATHLLNDDLANRIAINVELGEGSPVPYDQFQVGDIAQFQAAGSMEKHDRRISEIGLSAVVDDEGEVIWTPAITASKLFIGHGAINEAVYKLLREFKRMPEEAVSFGGVPGEGGGTPTITIAASNSSEWSKAKADTGFQCVGVNDHIIIAFAIAELFGFGGRIVLCEGNYTVDLNTLVLGGNIHIMGMNSPDGTVIRTHASGITGDTILEVADDCTVSDLSVQSTNCSVACTGIAGPGADNVTIRNVWATNVSVAVEHNGENWTLDHVTSNLTPTFIHSTVAGNSELKIVNCRTAGLIDISGTTDVVIDDNILGSLIELGAGENITIGAGNVFKNPGGAGTHLIHADGASGITLGAVEAFDGSGYDAVLFENCTGIKVDGGQYGNITSGLYFDTCSIVQVDGVQIGLDGYLGQHGLSFVDCDDVQVNGIQVIDPGQDADNTYDGMFVSGGSGVSARQVKVRSSSAVSPQPRYGVNFASGTGHSYLDCEAYPSANFATGQYGNAAGATNTFPSAGGAQGDNL